MEGEVGASPGVALGPVGIGQQAQGLALNHQREIAGREFGAQRLAAGRRFKVGDLSKLDLLSCRQAYGSEGRLRPGRDAVRTGLQGAQSGDLKLRPVGVQQWPGCGLTGGDKWPAKGVIRRPDRQARRGSFCPGDTRPDVGQLCARTRDRLLGTALVKGGEEQHKDQHSEQVEEASHAALWQDGSGHMD